MASSTTISTVYVRNLEERVKVETLSASLNTLFSEFGNVIDIVAKTNVRSRGQAFVVFDNSKSALNAVSEIDGFALFDKPMQLSMARTKSDKTVESFGSREEVEAHARHRQAQKEKRMAQDAAEEIKNLKRGATGAADARPAKVVRPSGLKSSNVAASTVVPDEYLPPNKILFLQNLPEGYEVEGLSTIFGRFDGFREVRLVPGRRGIAFVEYDAEQGAITAKENTAGMTLGDKSIKVTYQRQ